MAERQVNVVFEAQEPPLPDGMKDPIGRLAKAAGISEDTVVDAMLRFSLGLSDGGVFHKLYTTALLTVATPRERHIYRHTKKRRTRKKYEDRLHRRLMAIQEAEAHDEGHNN